jgi:hypothetical protein
MRLGLAVAAAALVSPLAFAEPTIHLDNDRLDAIRQSDPARYERIAEVLRVAEAQPCQTAPQVLKTKLDVDAKCQGYVVYTSLPPKTVLHFTLEGTDYDTFVVQPKLDGGAVVPVKK